MEPITVTGIVLSSTPSKDYDRRVVLLTKERGKVVAFANGVRKPGSQLSGRVHPFSFGNFVLREGRNSYTLLSAEIHNYFSSFREDMIGAYYGMYFMEFAMYYAKEANDETQLLKLLYQSLRALENKHLPNSLVRTIFELRIVCINGEGPQVFECVACNKKTDSLLFSVRRGGILCQSCVGKVSDARTLMPATLYAMQYIVSSSIEKLYTFVLKDEVLEELQWFVRRYLEEYIGKRFQSLTILETLIS